MTAQETSAATPLACPRCSRALPGGPEVRFCPTCGYALGQGDVIWPHAPAWKRERTAAMRVIWVMALAALVVIGVGAVLVAVYGERPPVGAPGTLDTAEP